MKTRVILIDNTKSTRKTYEYFSEICHLGKNLKNTANFYIRNLRSGLQKEESKRTVNEVNVIETSNKAIDMYNKNQVDSFDKVMNDARELYRVSAMAASSRISVYCTKHKMKTLKHFDKKHWMPSYDQLYAVMYYSKNRDYFALPGQVNQQTLRMVIKDWKGHFESLKSYKTNPAKFTGMPKAPGYVRTQYATVRYTNQIITKTSLGEAEYLDFPKEGPTLCIGKKDCCPKLVKVEIKPYMGKFEMLITYDKDVTEVLPEAPESPKRIIGIDPGIDNFLTGTPNFPIEPLIISGKWIKCENQNYNKQRARLLSELAKGLDSMRSVKNSKRLNAISRKRDQKFRDFFYKTAYWIVDHCIKNDVDVIVCGHNEQQKQNQNIGKTNNQNFVCIPYVRFFDILKRVAGAAGLAVVTREESYTSKASLVDGDAIPTYEAGKETEYTFSGKRVKRGLYQTKNGMLINADVNGAGNIIRKEYPTAFDGITDWSYLTKSVIVVTREDLCRVKKTAAPTRHKKHRSCNRRYHHDTHWDKKIEYMAFFNVSKTKTQPVKAA